MTTPVIAPVVRFAPLCRISRTDGFPGPLGVSVVSVSPPLLLLGTGLDLLAGVTAWLPHPAGRGKPGGPRPRRVRDVGARRGHHDRPGCRMAGRRPATTAVDTTVTAGRVAAVDQTASTVPGPAGRTSDRFEPAEKARRRTRRAGPVVRRATVRAESAPTRAREDAVHEGIDQDP
ncbi:hypothetical protein ACIGG5_30975 [Streptomyces sp. NPDC085463]|uniref:hypothetical protein n=1 Tax=Streptomyces sp. NPDC085463 TaxID=3365724 RepID=UPI0037D8E6A0